MFFKQNRYCLGGGDIIFLQTTATVRSRILFIIAVPISITPEQFYEKQLSDIAIKSKQYISSLALSVIYFFTLHKLDQVISCLAIFLQPKNV